MTDKEKTLAFIEERIKWNEDMLQRDPKPSDIGRIEEAKCIRRFIISLQEKPVSIWHDASEKPEREDLLIETNDGRIIHRQSINNYGMVKRWAYTSDLLNLDNSCNFGKNLQEKPISEDLEEAAVDYAATGEFLDNGKEMIDFQKEMAFKAGARWREEQITKTAVGACVCSVYPLKLYNEVHYSVKYPLGVLPNKDGDKVKVIIIKEEGV